MTDRTKERTAESGMSNTFAAASNRSFGQWNNDWKRESGQASGPPERMIGVLLMIAAARVLEQRRKRERRQIE